VGVAHSSRGAATVALRGGGAEPRQVVARGDDHGLRLGLGFIGEGQSHEVRTVASRAVGWRREVAELVRPLLDTWQLTRGRPATY
jgi:hypothetical protein